MMAEIEPNNKDIETKVMPHMEKSEEISVSRENREQLEAQLDKERRKAEARAQAVTLELVGDLPYAEVKPPENILFVCKLNPVTQDEDLELIFSRFGTILSCEVIRDKRTGDSLQYAFIEFDKQKDCEQAYFKMHGVLIDDHRIHVDFSQSVSRLQESWRKATNKKRSRQAGGFGGSERLEKKRHYRAADAEPKQRQDPDMVFGDSETARHSKDETPGEEKPLKSSRVHSRSRSPRRRRDYNNRSYDEEKYDSRREDSYRDRHDERNSRRDRYR